MEKEVSFVRELYEKYPFPNRPLPQDIEGAKKKLIDNVQWILTTLDKKFDEKQNILDIGCGTGEITLAVALLNRAKVLGIDLSSTSIKKSRDLAKLLGIKNAQFEQKNLFDLNGDFKFDYVYSLGVLHHTPDPYQSFKKLVAVTKEGGYISIGLYNAYGGFHRRFANWFLDLVVGKDKNKRVKFARNFFYKKSSRIFKGASEDSCLYDQYAHPIVHWHTVEEVLGWFKRNNIQYIGSSPPIELSQNNYLAFFKQKILRQNINPLDYYQKSKRTFILDNYPIGHLVVQLGWMFNRSGLFVIHGKKNSSYEIQ